MKITDKDNELISIATEIVKDNCDLYTSLGMHVGCVVLAKSGNIYKGLNIKTSHSICAEQVAIGQALACGERELDTIVSVKMDNEGNVRVVSPCGLCRYTFEKMGFEDLNVIVEDVYHNTILKVKGTDLLPYPYKRVAGATMKKENKKK